MATASILANIAEALAGPGWCVTPGFLGQDALDALHQECRKAFAGGAFHAAGVGGGQPLLRSEIRGDHVLWVEQAEAGPGLRSVLSRLEQLRRQVNRELFLGLFDLEMHFAVYPPGAGYLRHLDRFRDDDRRALTVILYLNEDWGPEDGGQLCFWPEQDAEALEIAPTGGTLVTFLSDRFWHEVMPARRERMSLTGWFRRR